MSITLNADTSSGLVMTSDTSGEIKLQSAGADIATVDSSGITMASGKGLSGDGSSLTGVGKILQVVTAHKTDTFSTTASASSMAAVTGMSVSITPSSTSSKILVMLGCNMGSSADALVYYQLYRDATPIGIGDAAGSRPRTTGAAVYASGTDMFYGGIPISIHYLDSPNTTSAVTYSLKVGQNSSYTVYFNRIGSDRDTSTYDGRSGSSITVMEVAG